MMTDKQELTEIDKLIIETLMITKTLPKAKVAELIGKSSSMLNGWKKRVYQTSFTLEELERILSVDFYPEDAAAIVAKVYLSTAFKPR